MNGICIVFIFVLIILVVLHIINCLGIFETSELYCPYEKDLTHIGYNIFKDKYNANDAKNNQCKKCKNCSRCPYRNKCSFCVD